MNELNNNKLLSITKENNLACIVVVIIIVRFTALKLKKRDISLSYQKANDIE
jgi:hypothetical protein